MLPTDRSPELSASFVSALVLAIVIAGVSGVIVLVSVTVGACPGPAEAMGRGLSPPSCRSCPAHNKRPGTSIPGPSLVQQFKRRDYGEGVTVRTVTVTITVSPSAMLLNSQVIVCPFTVIVA